MKPSPAKKHPELKPSAYRWKCNLSTFKFESTAEIRPLEDIIGQDRALEALKLGVGLHSPGYNIYIAGLAGTGKATTVKKILETMLKQTPDLSDYAYVNNFRNPDMPILLTFKAGKALKFKYEVNALISLLRERIPQLLESESFNQKKAATVNKYAKVEQQLIQDFEKMINKDGLTLGQVQGEDGVHPEIMPVIEGKPVLISQIDELIEKKSITKKAAEKIYENYTRRQHDLITLVKKHVKIAQDLHTEIRNLEQQEADAFVKGALNQLREAYTEENVLSWLDSLEKDLLSSIQIFKVSQASPEALAETFPIDPFRAYDVNVILDNAGVTSVPVVIEKSPSMLSLFGTIERTPDRHGNWYSDFMNIKAGSMLRANGGFLVLRVGHLFEVPGVWLKLKRALTYMLLDIQDNHIYYQMPPSSLKPESIPIDLKVILVGNSYIYSLLADREDDFKKIFKVLAEFDYEVNRTKEVLVQFAHVIKKIISEEHLREFHKSAIASVMELAARLAGSKDKLTSRFSVIADIVREASFWAGEDGSGKVRSEHVRKAFAKAKERHALLEGKLHEMITENKIFIDTTGKKIGQVNGLAVYGNDLIAFGKPVRISSSVAPGNGIIINVEKESRLSGKTHDKAIQIISGFLREKFSHLTPLSITTNIVFEQSYGSIDGDSASIAELAAIISGITRLPINQSIAVTGSLNQKGVVQPIGGVNEKIEGFFKICKAKGLTRGQGVIIPASNIDNLMLEEEVMEAARNGEFHIYPVTNLSEALEILMGVKAGEISEDGCYPRNTIYGIATQNLKKMYMFNKDPFKLDKSQKQHSSATKEPPVPNSTILSGSGTDSQP
ncbi:MAG: AAA family ATPase [Ignavibacteriales bacterium]|nr:MAG: AAA family ATPase [Ignavibacteriaceae bacterium]MBW7873016.1 AAA family ATPase [Ignavibacteria bacterium]MCZ2142355.1 AAA family ATPase [Ignavibacteriales bacterium]MBV6445238.1 Lon protease [Ignavibacteriaceae bacterium]MBZ0197129.1 AAA family ATPase [Ignavibacteriaceae bacterium]